MKLSPFLIIYTNFVRVEAHAGFNSVTENQDLARLQLFGDYGEKFFLQNKEVLTKGFYEKWAGQKREFRKEIRRIEQIYDQNCPIDISNSEKNENHEKIESLEPFNLANRMRNINLFVQKWSNENISRCEAYSKISRRWEKIESLWEAEIQNNLKLQANLTNDEVMLSNKYIPGKPCGRIYSNFNLGGESMLLYDSATAFNGFNDLSKTDFGAKTLFSMQPFEDCYIRAYQLKNKQGYSAVCDNPSGCGPLMLDPSGNFYSLEELGFLIHGSAQSVYCYCNTPAPRFCAEIFKNDDDKPISTTAGNGAKVFDGAKLGYASSMGIPQALDYVFLPDKSLSKIHVYGGCEVTIWNQMNEKGDSFTCPGYDDGYTCHYNSLGEVGNDKTQCVKCTCPVDFLSIEYEQDRADWVLDLNMASGYSVDILIAENRCNPDTVKPHQCSDIELQSSQSKTVQSQHSWGYIFKAGVTYSASASLKLEGFGVKTSESFTVEQSLSTGAVYTASETISSSQKCVAKPMTKVTCRYVAYEGEIEVEYTINWKNHAPTHGTYRGHGWTLRLETDAEKIL